MQPALLHDNQSLHCHMVIQKNCNIRSLPPFLNILNPSAESSGIFEIVPVIKLGRGGLGHSYAVRVKWSHVVNSLEEFWLADDGHILLSASQRLRISDFLRSFFYNSHHHNLNNSNNSRSNSSNNDILSSANTLWSFPTRESILENPHIMRLATVTDYLVSTC